jgi:general secretion pathway protein I
MTTKHSNIGFTLLEVMVALAIIATVLVALLGSHLGSLNLAQKHKEQTLTAQFARQKMEENMLIPFDSLESDSGDFGPAHPEYGWELQVEETAVENLKYVMIIIRSSEGEFRLETMVARRIVE